jgi:hypothetical protein
MAAWWWCTDLVDPVFYKIALFYKRNGIFKQKLEEKRKKKNDKTQK